MMSVSEESCCCSDLQMIIREMKREHGLLIDLRHQIMALLLRLNSEQSDSDCVLQAFQDILCCSIGVISKMEGLVTNYCLNSEQGGDKLMKGLSEDGIITRNKKTKNARHTGSVVTAAPDYDGHEWRKYGQKWISKAKHSRSYYKCTNRKEQGCMATKTVQQIENIDSSSSNVAKLYDVDYFGEHTCQGDDIVCPYIIETDCQNTFSTSHPKCSKTRLTNESDYHHQLLQDEINPENLFAMPDMSLFSDDMCEIFKPEDVIVNSPFSFQQEAMDSSDIHGQRKPDISVGG